MADQTFTPGQILTASQMTTLQENSGLSYIKSQTIGSAVSSVTVTSAFSADFDNYKILVNDFTPTAATQFVLTLGGITTNYSFQLNYGSFNSTASALGSTLTCTHLFCQVQRESSRFILTTQLVDKCLVTTPTQLLVPHLL